MRDDADREADRQWWERTWTEREDAMWAAFGPSHPPGSPQGSVWSFDRKRVPLPGACAYVFPPNADDATAGRERRDHWLYATHGMAQWLTPAALAAARAREDAASGLGFEFALVLDDATPWAHGLLHHLVQIDCEKVAAGERRFERGDRIAFYFTSLRKGDTLWTIGGFDGPDGDQVGTTRSLMFWPYLSPYATFTTETGTFELRVATFITGEELALAQETSSCHLLLMLEWAGVGQRSRPERRSLTEFDGWERRWADISQMPLDEAKAALRAIARRRKEQS